MSHDSHVAHETNSHAALFSPADWENIRAEDRAGAKAISGLMIGIFSTGLILYSLVAWTF